ncbi:NAD(P)/FAD-dependent oxidoreductase [bacterium]|nr:NAD(P)/FAD-dependent oxidoreductase [candidate division CSSED10-310 bacterium]
MAAIGAAQKGISVLVLDRKSPGFGKERCAGLVPRLLFTELPVSAAGSVIQPVTYMETVYPSKIRYTTYAPGFILNRTAFDNILLQHALSCGVMVWFDVTCHYHDGETVTVLKQSKPLKIKPRIIIAADGPVSYFARHFFPLQRQYILALQYINDLHKPSETYQIFFNQDFYGGYGWCFPAGDIAKIGIGIQTKSGISIKSFLDSNIKRLIREIADLNGLSLKPRQETFGLIPISPPPDSMVFNNIVLAGDAANQTHPITGSGIAQAVTCGYLAGLSVRKTIETGNKSFLSEYDQLWRQRWFPELQRAHLRRQELLQNWHDLETALSTCWVTSKAYYDF